MLHQIIAGAKCFLVKFIDNDLTIWKIQQIILRIRAKNSHEDGKDQNMEIPFGKGFLGEKKTLFILHF